MPLTFLDTNWVFVIREDASKLIGSLREALAYYLLFELAIWSMALGVSIYFREA